MLRQLTAQQLRLKLAGEVVIGYIHEWSEEIQLIKQPSTLIYERPYRYPIKFIGGLAEYTAVPEIPGFTPFFHRHPPRGFTNYSSASLVNVSCVRIYYETDVKLCEGIILEYLDGSERAIGHCKVGIDQFQECTAPDNLCYAPFIPKDPSCQEQQLVQVLFSKKNTHEHSGIDWTCCAMEGTLGFWFNEKETKIEILAPN